MKERWVAAIGISGRGANGVVSNHGPKTWADIIGDKTTSSLWTKIRTAPLILIRDMDLLRQWYAISHIPVETLSYPG